MTFALEKTIVSNSETDTQSCAHLIADHLQAGDMIALVGNLGMGKSVMARALVRRLVGQPEMDVPSPTFTLVQSYNGKKFEVWHADLYRLEHPDEVYALGLDEALDYAMIMVEWPDRLPDYFQADCLVISLQQGQKANSRQLTFMGNGQWKNRLASSLEAYSQDSL